MGQKGRTIAVFLSLILATASINTFGASQEVWEVLLKDIPVRITTADAGLNMSLYVLKQTHEPMLRTDDGENYTSRILRSWSRDLTSQNYRFCPDTSLEFIPGEKFTYESFLSHISSITASFNPDSKIIPEQACVKVSFSAPMRRYLDYLTLYEHAPTRKKDAVIEVGLGEFYPESVRPESIRLRRKRRVRRGYNTIIIHKYAGPADPNLENRRISDFNKMQISTIPDWVKRDYAHFDSTILQTVVLILNHPDKNIRRIVYNCMDVDSLRRAYYPTWKEFVDIQNLLPVGVPGAVPGLPEQKCDKASLRKLPAPLAFINFGANNDAQMAAFMATFEKKTGIKVSVRKLQDKDIQDTLYHYPRKYDLVIVAMDAVRPDHAAFFDYLVREDGYFDFKLGKLADLYKHLLLEDNPVRRDELGAKMAGMVSSEYVLLPLLQVQRRFYYPRNIKNLTVGRGFLEYPEVAEFKW
jgi:hypothetical protein